MTKTEIIKEKTACFAGNAITRRKDEHYSFLNVGKLNLNSDEDYEKFTKMLYKEITIAIENGYDTFLMTLESVFEIMAAELIYDAQQEYDHLDIKLIGVILPNQGSEPEYYLDKHWKGRYHLAKNYCKHFVAIEDIPDDAEHINHRVSFTFKHSSLSFMCFPLSMYIESEEGMKTIPIPL